MSTVPTAIPTATQTLLADGNSVAGEVLVLPAPQHELENVEYQWSQHISSFDWAWTDFHPESKFYQ